MVSDYNINIDLKLKPSFPTILKINQYDRGVYIKVNLFDNGEPYTILNTETPIVEFALPQGKGYIISGDSIKDISGNSFRVAIDRNISLNSGEASFNVALVDKKTGTTTRKGSFKNSIKIISNSIDEGTVSSDLAVSVIETIQNNVAIATAKETSLREAIEDGDLDNYATVSQFEENMNLITNIAYNPIYFKLETETNFTNAFTRIMNLIETNNGGTILIPQNTVIEGDITITSNNCKIIGGGTLKGTILIDGTSKAVITHNGNNYNYDKQVKDSNGNKVTWSGSSFVLNGETITVPSKYKDWLHDITIKDITIKDGTLTKTLTEAKYCLSINFDNVTFSEGKYAFYVNKTDTHQTVSKVKFNNCKYISNCYNYYIEGTIENSGAYYSIGDVQINNPMFENRYITNENLSHIYAEGQDGIIINTSTFFNVENTTNTMSSIKLKNFNFAIINGCNIFESNGKSCEFVNGNNLKLIGNNIAWGKSTGLYLENINSCNIDSNTLDTIKEKAIVIKNCNSGSPMSFSNNTIKQPTSKAFEIINSKMININGGSWVHSGIDDIITVDTNSNNILINGVLLSGNNNSIYNLNSYSVTVANCKENNLPNCLFPKTYIDYSTSDTINVANLDYLIFNQTTDTIKNVVVNDKRFSDKTTITPNENNAKMIRVISMTGKTTITSDICVFADGSSSVLIPSHKYIDFFKNEYGTLIEIDRNF